QRVLPRQADGYPGDAPDHLRAAGPAARARAVLPRGQSAVPGQQRRGRHREGPGPPPPRDERGQRSEPGPVGGLVPGPGRRSGAAPRSHAGAPAAQRPSPDPRGTPAPPAQITSASAGTRSSETPGQPTITAPGAQPIQQVKLTIEYSGGTTQSSIRAAQDRTLHCHTSS